MAGGAKKAPHGFPERLPAEHRFRDRAHAVLLGARDAKILGDAVCQARFSQPHVSSRKFALAEAILDGSSWIGAKFQFDLRNVVTARVSLLDICHKGEFHSRFLEWQPATGEVQKILAGGVREAIEFTPSEYASLLPKSRELQIQPRSEKEGQENRMIPGEVFIKDGDIELNAGRKTVTLNVANTGDRPIQVGSHYHFFETNPALKFDRKKARGMRLDIAAGTAVRFEPGQTRDVQLVALAGKRVVYGFRGDSRGVRGAGRRINRARRGECGSRPPSSLPAAALIRRGSAPRPPPPIPTARGQVPAGGPSLVREAAQ